MFLPHLLSDDQVAALGEAVIATLDRVRVLCQDDGLLDSLAAAGARVDRVAQTVSFPADLTRSWVAGWRGEGPLPLPAVGPLRPPAPPIFSTQVAQLVYDYPSGERRQGTRADLVEIAKIGDVLHRDAGVGHSLLCTDVPPLLEPLEAALILAEHAHHPHPAFAWNVRQIDYLREMGEVLGRPHWYAWGAICIAHPFRFDRDVAAKLYRRAREGVASGLTAMPVAGMTTPLPPAGFVTAAAAEMVACWLMVKAVNPACGLAGSIWPGTLDMRTGAVSYCAFDAMANGFALTEFLRRWTGVTVAVGGGEYCDAREPGYYAVWEKAYKALLIAAYTGHHPGIGSGLLEEGKTLSVEQLLLEREVTAGLAFLGHPLEVSPLTLALDDIAAVGCGQSAHLSRDLTLDHFREWTWCPPCFDRGGYAGAPTDRAVLDRLAARKRELLAAYERPPVDPDQLAALRAVVARARRELLR